MGGKHPAPPHACQSIVRRASVARRGAVWLNRRTEFSVRAAFGCFVPTVSSSSRIPVSAITRAMASKNRAGRERGVEADAQRRRDHVGMRLPGPCAASCSRTLPRSTGLAGRGRRAPAACRPIVVPNGTAHGPDEQQRSRGGPHVAGARPSSAPASAPTAAWRRAPSPSTKLIAIDSELGRAEAGKQGQRDVGAEQARGRGRRARSALVRPSRRAS